MGVNIQRNWFLLTSKLHKDAEAEQQLLNQGYTVYRPQAQRLRKYRGKMIKRVESLFPRYLFIYLDKNGLNDNWTPIRYTRGVSGFVRFGVEPAQVPDSLISTLQSEEILLGEKAIDLDRFHAGDKTIITQGPFQGLEAVFQRYDGEERAMVLITLLQQKQTQLCIEPGYLCAA